MSATYQSVTLVGNLGADPDLKTTKSGIPYTRFSVAVDQRNGDESIWFRVTTWRKLAETCNRYLQKGRQVLIVGELEPNRPYSDKDGNPRCALQINAQVVKFLDGPNGGESHAGDDADPENEINFMGEIPF